MATIINSHIGLNRGKVRLFLEGVKLFREGYTPGMRYDVSVEDRVFRLEFNDTGKYKVSRRIHRSSGIEYPVIDYSANELAELFEENETVRVLVKKGHIIVSSHEHVENGERRESRLLRKLVNGEPLDICSVYHGNGILDSACHTGLASYGVKTQLALVIEKEAKYLDSSLRNNCELWTENSLVVNSYVENFNFREYDFEVDLYVSGFPCTGASISGRTKNKLEKPEDHVDAGSGFFYTLQLIQWFNPSIVVLENVPLFAKTAGMSVIRSVLDSLGYDVQERVLNGYAYGGLENRDRLVIVATSKGIDAFDIDKVEPLRGKYKRPEHLSEVLEDIPDDSELWKDFDYLKKKEVRDIEAGKGFRRQLLTGDEAYLKVIGRFYAKCRSTEPFILNKNNPSLSRILTKLEHARVKTIPFELVKGLSNTIAHEAMGQSIVYCVFDAVFAQLSLSLRLWKVKNVTNLASYRCKNRVSYCKRDSRKVA